MCSIWLWFAEEDQLNFIWLTFIEQMFLLPEDLFLCANINFEREYSIIFIVLWWIRRLKLFCGTFIYLAWPTFNFFSTKSNHNYSFKKINILRNIADVCFYFFFILQEKNTTESVTYINARLLTTPIIISS